MRVIDTELGVGGLNVPLDDTDIAFVGQCVKWGGDGVLNIGTASGVYDTSTEARIAGIVRGENTDAATAVLEDGTVVSGFSGRKVTGVNTQATQKARKVLGNKGMYKKADVMNLLFLDTVRSFTRIEAPIYNAAYGTAPSVLTADAISADGLTIAHTATAADFTPAASDLSTIFCRSGINAGLYRVCTDTSTTTTTVDKAFPDDIAVDDTFVKVNIRQGHTRMQTDAEGLYIDTGADLSANYWGIEVEYLDLRNAGQEKAIFTWNVIHFLANRAT